MAATRRMVSAAMVPTVVLGMVLSTDFAAPATAATCQAPEANIDPPPGFLYLFLASAEDQRNVGTALFLADGTFFGVGTRGAFLSSYLIQYDVAMPARIAPKTTSATGHAWIARATTPT